jgi:hypothetical protein
LAANLAGNSVGLDIKSALTSGRNTAPCGDIAQPWRGIGLSCCNGWIKARCKEGRWINTCGELLWGILWERAKHGDSGTMRYGCCVDGLIRFI